MLEAVKMCKHKDLSDFDKGQIVVVRRLSQSILKNCSSCGEFTVCSGQHLSTVVQRRESSELVIGSWAAKVYGEQRLPHRQAIVAQTAKKLNSVSESASQFVGYGDTKGILHSIRQVVMMSWLMTPFIFTVIYI